MKKDIRKRKPAVLISVVIVLLLLALLILGMNYQRQQITDLHKESLQTLANEKAAQVDLFLESQKEKSLILSSMNVFREVAKDPNNSSKIEEANKRIGELRSIFPGISVTTTEGIVIVGDIDLPGTDYSSQPYFAASKKKIAFDRYYDPLRKQDYYAVVGPIYDRVETEKIVGLITFDLELNRISALMNETLDSESNEVYLIDETGLLLSGSEFIGKDNKKGILIQVVESEGALSCLEDLKEYGTEDDVEEHEETVSEYVNYMGNSVFGAYAYSKNIMGCVIAEKSSDEVLKFDLLEYVKKLLGMVQSP